MERCCGVRNVTATAAAKRDKWLYFLDVTKSSFSRCELSRGRKLHRQDILLYLHYCTAGIATRISVGRSGDLNSGKASYHPQHSFNAGTKSVRTQTIHDSWI